MKFLVVDDSTVDRHLLTSVIEALGHEVEACSTTQGVIDRLISGSYAALFLDIVMPEQDGYKFLREVRSNENTASTHIIFCSSKKTTLEINYGLKRAGADDYLVKPVSKETVAKVIEKVGQ